MQQSDAIEGVSLRAVRLVIRAIERLVVGRHFEDVCDELLAGGGLGLLCADAMSRALRRVGPWPLRDHVAAFLQRLETGDMATARTAMIFEAVSKINSSTLLHGDDGDAEDARDGIMLGIDELCRWPKNWLARCLLELARYSTWAAFAARSDYPVSLERAADDLGLDLASILSEECDPKMCRALISSLGELGKPAAKAEAPERKKSRLAA